MSGTTFVTLGLGDVTPTTASARILTTVESGHGVRVPRAGHRLSADALPGVLATRERRSRSSTRAPARRRPPRSSSAATAATAPPRPRGAPPRLGDAGPPKLLESHISFPVLAFYRSQHDNQSWVAALTTILDVCALVIARHRGRAVRTARLTFAMARHALVDLSQRPRRRGPRRTRPDRLPPDELDAPAASSWPRAGVPLKAAARTTRRAPRDSPAACTSRTRTRSSDLLLMPLPPWRAAGRREGQLADDGIAAASAGRRRTRRLPARLPLRRALVLPLLGAWNRLAARPPRETGRRSTVYGRVFCRGLVRMMGWEIDVDEPRAPATSTGPASSSATTRASWTS